jgi:zinc/manganese transport system substrate-binding protein
MKARGSIAALVCLLLLLSACGPLLPANGKKNIVVTYSILSAVVKELVGDQANVVVLIPNGLDPHEWAPSARAIEAVNKADLVIQNGLGLEGGLEKTLKAAEQSGVKFFTASDYITVRHVGAGEGIPTGDPDQALGATDPHLWTDPLAMKDIVAGLSPVLRQEIGLDVDIQAENLETRLEGLNNQVAGIVAALPSTERKLVTGHESMGYFAQRYGFALIGVIVPSLSSQGGVSASDLSQAAQAVRANQVKAIFTELGTSPAVVQAIAAQTGVEVVRLTTHALPADGSFSTFLVNLANTITNALE